MERNNCAICQDPLSGLTLHWPGCLHPFHCQCVYDWRSNELTGATAVCPLCKRLDTNLVAEMEKSMQRAKDKSYGIRINSDEGSSSHTCRRCGSREIKPVFGPPIPGKLELRCEKCDRCFSVSHWGI
ncbi:hypothetical protein PGT21_015393 [Puccinia graminis f. sp. tritici]|uniref:RING-type domain-containing protein n=1 Tax=Puccinia graminis f. sp. tritici TaxID=56615 RepID=A0A5B0NQH6_PUCGR|nr:hypothetical protein PGT21_015393 [Puccinia graminis f. sp. tritici]